MSKKRNWAENFKSRIDRSPFTILLVISVFFISSLITISQGIKRGYDYFQSNIVWRNVEYHRINSVQAGMSLSKFNEVFGSPLFSRESDNGYKEYIYRERDYWIQAITSSSGEVAFYSITSCSSNFKPIIEQNPINAKIVLQESTFKSVSDSINDAPNNLRYYFRVATANSQYYDSYSWGNPSSYKTVFVGINDACNEPKVGISDEKYEYGIEDLSNPQVLLFRQKAVLNSYGESSPFYDYSEVLKGFQFGVDRIQIRTLQ